MIDMNTQNEVMLRAEYEDQSVHKLPLEMLGLQAVEGRPDILVLRLRPQGGKGDYLYVSCLSMKLSKAAETQRMSHRGFQSLCHIRVRTVQLPPTSL